jgi:nucleoside-diphosphate-sugar epimerase
MKFIVTGGAGFIGHNVVHILESWGHQCLVIDNFTDYGFIPHDELYYLLTERHKRIRSDIISLDLMNFNSIDVLIEKHKDADAIIHLASFPRQKIVSQNPVVAANVMGAGLVNLIQAAKKQNISKFVYISSSMVYGDFNNDVTEDSVCRPIGQYGIMKYMGEWLVQDATRQGYFNHVIIRPSAVYGEYDVEDRVVSKFMLGAMRGQTLKVKGASEVLDFTYVEDTATGIALAATKDVANNKIYNITRADTKLYTLLEAAEIAVKIAGRGSIEITDKDTEFPSRGRLSIDRAVKDLEYSPKTNVEQGFQKYHDWFAKSSYWSPLL